MQKWLVHLGATQSAALFAEAEVDGQRLFALTHAELAQLHVPPAEAASIEAELTELRTQLGLAPPAASPHPQDGAAAVDAPPIMDTLKKRPPPPVPAKRPSLLPPGSPQPPVPGNGAPSPKQPKKLSATQPPVPGNGAPVPTSPVALLPQATICAHCGAEQKWTNTRCKTCGEELAPEMEPKGKSFTLKSILRLPGQAKRPGHIHFDEMSIAATRQESRAVRGIQARLDDATRAAPYYLGPVLRNQAADYLFAARDGAFVLFDSLSSPDHLYLTHVRGGELTHALIENQPLGVCLKRSKHLFDSVGSLVEFFCGDNDEAPNMLSIEAALAAVAQRGARQRLVQPDSGYETDLDDYKSTQWFRGGLTDDDAIELIEFEPSGSFVVYNGAEPDEFVLQMVFKGQPVRRTIVRAEGGFHFGGVAEYFPTVGRLVVHYSKEAADALPCQLKLPKTPANATSVDANETERLSQAAPSSAAYLQTSLSKLQATEAVIDAVDGTFVIRCSESRPGCYVLTYKAGEFAHHELIQCTEGRHVGYVLEVAPEKEFGSMEDLVRYFEYPRPELRCALVRPAFPDGKPPVRTSGPRKSSDPSPQSASPAAQSSPRPVRKGSDQPSGGSPAPQPVSFSARKASQMQVEDGSVAILSPSVPRSLTRNAANQATVSGGHCVRVDARAAMAKWCCLSLTKDEALQELPRDRDGAFVVRKGEKGEFAVLTAIMKGKEYNVEIEEAADGLRLKKGSGVQPNLSALIAYYKHTQQPDLPHPLIAW